MKVIFLQDVPRVGKKYDVKEVNDGYAMNFLLPRKLVELATPKSIAELEIRKKNIVVKSGATVVPMTAVTRGAVVDHGFDHLTVAVPSTGSGQA